MSARLAGVGWISLIAFACLSGVAAAQAPEGHEQHHPGDGPAVTPPVPPAPAAPPRLPAATPAPPMDMEQMMREMQRMMGGPPKKPLVSRLLTAERLTESERNTLRGDAERAVQEGLQRLERGARELARARASGDEAAQARAVETLREGTAQWDTGRAVLVALSSSTPREAGIQWFKAQMNLERPSAVPGALWGLSWRHAGLMAILVLVGAAAVSLYVYKVRRSLSLLARLTRDDGRS